MNSPSAKPIVLVVDDEGGLRSLYRTLLERAGYAVRLAPDANAAIEILEDPEIPIAVVLTDIQMPGMSGLGLCKWLSEHHPGVPTILMSGHLLSLPEGALDGHDRILCKPFPCTELLSAMRDALGKPDDHREQAAPSP